MTVAELRALLADAPADAVVLVTDGDADYTFTADAVALDTVGGRDAVLVDLTASGCTAVA